MYVVRVAVLLVLFIPLAVPAAERYPVKAVRIVVGFPPGGADDTHARVRLVKVNTEEAQQTAMRFGIRSIPTLAVFRGGREIARQAGAMDYAALTGWIRANV